MNYLWTKHAEEKLKFYGLSKQRVVRVIRHPNRIEEAIVPECVAVMQPINKKHASEIWSMYVKKPKLKTKKLKLNNQEDQIKIISTWRYPGKSPVRGEVPIPDDILEQLNTTLQ